MKRRTFLNSTLVFAIGAGLSSTIIRLGQKDTSYLPSDTERSLLAFYNPAHSSLVEMFPTITSYPEALDELKQRGLLANGYMNIDQLSAHAESDPIIDFLGWQHLESELLVFLAAYYLVKESSGQISELGSEKAKPTYNQTKLLSNIDFQGQAIKVYSVATKDDDTAAGKCSSLCTQEPSCEFFTLGRSNHPTVEKRHVCWLVREGATVRKSPNYISGVKFRQ